MNDAQNTDSVVKPTNFIRNIIDQDLASGKQASVQTRFPSEPNGFLHIGHAKAICINFGIADDYDGKCNLRFDDTNPAKEESIYAEAIAKDIQWLGFEWAGDIRHSADYFDKLYGFAQELINKGLAYVCELNIDEMRDYRGTLTEPGRNSPYRERDISENSDLLRKMKAGDYADGTLALRAKIDMSSPNINMRDPVIYRIKRAHHIRTGDKWCIYPTYDFTHGISDAIEGVTHSLCTLEFEDHRPLYDWFLDQLPIACHPQQIEFARLQLEYTIVSKRKLAQLVAEKHVDGWDDPRMPTIAGLRRAGYTPASIRDFCERIGITKKDSWIEMGVLENCIREDLNENAPRAMAVLQPLKVVIENYPEDQTEILKVSNHPQKPELGTRKIPFAKVIWIEQDDFAQTPPAKYKRLIEGGEVRLRSAYVIKCNQVITDNEGKAIELRCSYDPATLGKKPEGRKVKGVIHWVSEAHALDAKIRLYDRLFNVANPESEENFLNAVNPNSLQTLHACKVEASLSQAKSGQRFQFERTGYFCVDCVDSETDKLVFNRTVTLRDTWS
ncbi:MAG: glutamine--tRNA ligase/YqeY domain fusion protein [Kangiellaceae bacterium]|nr:glutamine--tRNA ligase/YqeY domain fusion protein [Kangiellaceae bacterium]